MLAMSGEGYRGVRRRRVRGALSDARGVGRACACEDGHSENVLGCEETAHACGAAAQIAALESSSSRSPQFALRAKGSGEPSSMLELPSTRATPPSGKALRRDDHHEGAVSFTACGVFVDDLDQPAVSGRARHPVTAVSQLPVAAPVADCPFDLVGGEAQQTTRDVRPAGYFDEELRHGVVTIPSPCVLSQLAFSTHSGATLRSQAHDIAARVGR
jgi:hypothetical protein